VEFELCHRETAFVDFKTQMSGNLVAYSGLKYTWLKQVLSTPASIMLAGWG
jgi:hypothetical protein